MKVSLYEASSGEENEKLIMRTNLYPGADSTRKMKTILILNPHYLPGFKAGGPIQSIAGIVERLKDEFDFKVICGDRDGGDGQPYASEPIGRWYEYGVAKVLRVPPGLAGAIIIIRALRLESYDVLYINGFLSRIYSMLPLACREWVYCREGRPCSRRVGSFRGVHSALKAKESLHTSSCPCGLALTEESFGMRPPVMKKPIYADQWEILLPSTARTFSPAAQEYQGVT